MEVDNMEKVEVDDMKADKDNLEVDNIEKMVVNNNEEVEVDNMEKVESENLYNLCQLDCGNSGGEIEVATGGDIQIKDDSNEDLENEDDIGESEETLTDNREEIVKERLEGLRLNDGNTRSSLFPPCLLSPGHTSTPASQGHASSRHSPSRH